MDLVEGWRFVTADDEKLHGEYVRPDPLHADFKRIRELYYLADPEYEGRYTVPTLWDKKLDTIVSNESADIIRMFNTEFDGLLGPDEDKRGGVVDLYPKELQEAIDEANMSIYDNINNGI
jgi:putative glutathione S-transferase